MAEYRTFNPRDLGSTPRGRTNRPGAQPGNAISGATNTVRSDPDAVHQPPDLTTE